MSRLSEVTDIAIYTRLFDNEAFWRPVMVQIAQRHGLPAAALQRCPTGSAIVYRCAGAILKLFAPFWPEEMQRERLGLRACAQLPIPVPELWHEGCFEDWDYLILQELPGVSLGTLWADLPAVEQGRLLSQAAEIMLALHAQRLPDNPYLGLAWPDFVQQQVQTFAHQQRAKGLAAHWVEPLDQWLQSHFSCLLETSPVLLHSDLTEDHFLVQEQGGHWQVTGLIDFGDLMQGHRVYEFGAPLVFYTRGKPRLRQHFVQQYGLPLDPETENQLFAALLVHRFVNIPWYLKHLCPPDIQDVNALKHFFCGLNENSQQ